MDVQRKPGKKGKRKDERPARKRYWAGRHLEKNKVKNLMKHCGMTKVGAILFWTQGHKDPKKHNAGKRLGRVPDKYLVA